ncbi:DUF4157 domain-containing protein [Undibacterium sp. Di26W]|uniref:eCIS core domain-containing protein n=1 Tax=Undibacterium sp. Di26W TaxID=3413035 RepID=UPI003BF132A1
MKSRVSTPAEDSRQNAFAQDKPLQQFANPLGFVDLRPQAIAQRKLQEMAANSPQAMQLKAYQAMMDARSARTMPGYLQGKPGQMKFDGENAAQQNGQQAAKDAGLPHQLKAGIESLSGMSMDHVKVHYDSAQPAQLQAHAYAQGSDIHVAPGQEQHLPHEAWHVVQQAQGRVRPTLQMAGDGSSVVQRAAATIAYDSDDSRSAKLKGYSDKASTANIKKTKVSFETGRLTTSKETVGLSMVANPLGPDHPQGGEPNSFVARKHFSTHMKKNGVNIRGHLLNGDLGGPGSEQNLFPITAQANSHHYQYIEKRAKYWINDLKSWLRYEVKVTGRDDAKGIADFECELAPVDADGNDTQWLRKLKVHSEPDASTSAENESNLDNKKAAMSDDTNFTDDDIEYSEGKTPIGYRPIEQDVEERMRIDAGKSTLGMTTLVWNLKQLSISEDSAEEIQSYIDSGDEAVFQNNNKGAWNKWVKNINENY